MYPLPVSPGRGNWSPTGYRYRGYPVYVSRLDGTMAYEADYERLVTLPEAVENAILDAALAQEVLVTLSAAALAALRRRVH